MTKAEFLSELGEVLDLPEPLAPGQSLRDIETFDSLGVLNIMSLLDRVGVQVDPKQIIAAETSDGLLALAGSRLED